MEHALEFAGPGGGVVTNFPLENVLTAFFTRLAPGRPLPAAPKSLEQRTYNWGTDQTYWTAEGDGILIALDVATEVLLQVAAANGLVFVRRDDKPKPPWPRL